MNGLTRNSGQICLGTLAEILQCIFVFFCFLVGDYLSARSIRSHSDIGKMTNYFHDVSLKIFNFVQET